MVYDPRQMTGDGGKVVTTPNTAVPLKASETRASWVTVSARKRNTGTVWIGTSSVKAYVTGSGDVSSRGLALEPGGVYQELPVNDLSLVYLDATTAGDGVDFIYGE